MGKTQKRCGEEDGVKEHTKWEKGKERKEKERKDSGTSHFFPSPAQMSLSWTLWRSLLVEIVVPIDAMAHPM